MVRLAMCPGIRLIDHVLLPEAGAVLLEREATVRADPKCTCTEGACFKDGMIGRLSDEQRKDLCKEEEPFPPAVAERVRKFLEAGRTCDHKLESRVLEDAADLLAERLVCMCRELSKMGLEVCG